MIKFLDLKKINDRFDYRFKVVFDRMLKSGRYLLGQELCFFERDFARECKARRAVGVGSGLDALVLALRACHTGEGHEVIVPSNAYIATVHAISICGATPVFVEPNPETYLIDEMRIEEKITSRTRAIIPVHLYGQLCDMNALHKFKFIIIDDMAQGHGLRCRGDISCFSFYPSKNLGALSDAGMVVTNDNGIANDIQALRNYGSCQKGLNKFIGLNSRMDELNAAILNIKLGTLGVDNLHRQNIASYYLKNIKNDRIILPKQVNEHVWHLFVIRTKERNELIKYLGDNGIQTQIHYPVPPHKQSCYPEYNKYSLPIAEQLANEVLSLPISPVMKEEEYSKIVEVINDWK